MCAKIEIMTPRRGNLYFLVIGHIGYFNKSKFVADLKNVIMTSDKCSQKGKNKLLFFKKKNFAHSQAFYFFLLNLFSFNLFSFNLFSLIFLQGVGHFVRKACLQF